MRKTVFCMLLLLLVGASSFSFAQQTNETLSTNIVMYGFVGGWKVTNVPAYPPGQQNATLQNGVFAEHSEFHMFIQDKLYQMTWRINAGVWFLIGVLLFMCFLAGRGMWL